MAVHIQQSAIVTDYSSAQNHLISPAISEIRPNMVEGPGFDEGTQAISQWIANANVLVNV